MCVFERGNDDLKRKLLLSMRVYLSRSTEIKKNQQKVARVEKKTDLYKRLIETIV